MSLIVDPPHARLDSVERWQAFLDEMTEAHKAAIDDDDAAAIRTALYWIEQAKTVLAERGGSLADQVKLLEQARADRLQAMADGDMAAIEMAEQRIQSIGDAIKAVPSDKELTNGARRISR